MAQTSPSHEPVLRWAIQDPMALLFMKQKVHAVIFITRITNRLRVGGGGAEKKKKKHCKWPVDLYYSELLFRYILPNTLYANINCISLFS